VLTTTNTASMTAATVSELAVAVDQITIWSTVTFGIMYLVLIVVFYLLSRHYMTRKLNLA
jgi:hypothetical protein